MGELSAIAIDGPVASGKTTVGKLLSKKLGLRFLDTGIMYRGLTWLALERRVLLTDEGALGALAQAAEMDPSPDGQSLVVNGRLLTEELRSPAVECTVSRVSEVHAVRKAMVKRQQTIAQEGAIVVVGRDIGSDVLPHAAVKVYLDASPRERARRRHLQMVQGGAHSDFDQVLEELEARDKLDTQRAHSPLRPAKDSHMVNTDGLNEDQVVEALERLVTQNN